MNGNCIANGNLALKQQPQRANLRLVVTNEDRKPSIFDELIECAFGFFYTHAGNEEVISVLTGTRKIAFLANALDRRVGILAGIVGTVALFYLSFFAF